MDVGESRARRDTDSGEDSDNPVQTLSDFLRNESHRSRPLTDMRLDGTRQSSSSSDRKRRLTNSTQEDGRRRNIPQRFNGGLNEDMSSIGASSSSAQPTSRRQDPAVSAEHEVVDLTSSSPPLPPLPLSHTRPTERLNRPDSNSSNGSRKYVVPPWQPDSEVSECPICGKPFTWMFRRHHCRKCGRVVCNDCSPHRITIPRQFIVNPPMSEMGFTSRSVSTTRPPETIDLTGDDNDDSIPSSGRRYVSTPILEGGEKVRLCNPCVPDPQPEPLPNYPPIPGSTLTSLDVDSLRSSQFQDHPSRRVPPGFSTHYPTGSSIGLSSSGTNPNIPSRYSGFSRHRYPLPFDPFGNQNLPPRYRSNSSLATGPESQQSMSTSYQPRPQILGTMNPSYPTFTHGRYQSLDSSNRSTPSGTRPLVRPIDRPEPSSSSYSEGFRHPPRISSRPRVHENDICPICRRLLPPRGVDGDETAREAHIMACITERDPSTQSSNGHASSSRGAAYMVRFTATEKDCVAEDGNVQECSICMIEYNVGDQLARLECLCKFHRECIVEWFGRKQECPVHKIT